MNYSYKFMLKRINGGVLITLKKGGACVSAVHLSKKAYL